MKESLRPALKLGVTGGIGSGKTTVCKVFSVLGIPVFSADLEARMIMNNDRDLKRQINALAGKDLYSTGSLDRKELAKLIFNNENLLEQVNSLVHPVVFEYFTSWVKEQKTPYAIMEAAILFESGAAALVDKIITVVTPVEERIARLVKSKKFSREQVMERIKNQIDDNYRIRNSDFVINNSENDMIIPVILDIHMELVDFYNKTK
jgi:dephospho-CoA kinase